MIKGPGATKFLDWFTCNKLPRVGRLNLTYALTSHGTTRTEFTIIRLSEDTYYLVSAGAWTDYDSDHLLKKAQEKVSDYGYIEISNCTNQWGVFAIAGPNSRKFLSKIVKTADVTSFLSNSAFRILILFQKDIIADRNQ